MGRSGGQLRGGVSLGKGIEPDWDQILRAFWYVPLSLDDEGRYSIVSRGIISESGVSPPYFTALSELPSDSARHEYAWMTGVEVIKMVRPGTGVIFDDPFIEVDPQMVDYLQEEVNRIGLGRLPLPALMRAFDFTEEDLHANRSGTITARQRQKLEGQGKWSLFLLLLAWVVASILPVLAVTVNTGPVLGVALSLVVVGALFCLFVGPWWYGNRYPLGEGRVKLLIAETSFARHPTTQKTMTRVGKGIGGHFLPELLHEGVLVRLYWNKRWEAPIVHSVEPARVGDVSNIRKRNVVGRVIIGLMCCFLALVAVLGYLDAQAREAERRELIDNLDLTPEIEPEGLGTFEPGDLDFLIPRDRIEVPPEFDPLLEEDLEGVVITPATEPISPRTPAE